MPPGKHAVLGASSSHRWMSCPGSVRLSEGRESETSVYAREGSAAHEIAEWSLRDGLRPQDYVGEIVLFDEEVEVTEEMAEAVAVYVEHVRQRSETATEQYIELEMSLAKLAPPQEMFGTGDCVLWHEEEDLLEIIDYKHGRGVAVDAVGNTQLQYYALAAVVTTMHHPKRIRMTIVQPRAAHPDGPIRSWEIGWADLVEFKNRLFEAAERTLLPDAELVVGEHCRFCPAMAVCPAQAAQANAVARTVFEAIPVEHTWASPPPAELQPDQLARILAVSGQIRDWLDAVEAHCLHEMDSGRTLPGFKLVEGRQGNRAWTDEQEAEAYLKRKKLKVDERYTKKLISPAQAEKVLKKKGVPFPDHLTSRSDGKPKIVPEDDPRPAIPATAQTVFSIAPNATHTERDSA